MVSSKISGSDLSEYTLYTIKKKFYKNQILGEKWKILCFFCNFFFKLLPKFSYFIDYDDCMGKITYESIRLYTVFIQNMI